MTVSDECNNSSSLVMVVAVLWLWLCCVVLWWWLWCCVFCCLSFSVFVFLFSCFWFLVLLSVYEILQMHHIVHFEYRSTTGLFMTRGFGLLTVYRYFTTETYTGIFLPLVLLVYLVGDPLTLSLLCCLATFTLLTPLHPREGIVRTIAQPAVVTHEWRGIVIMLLLHSLGSE